MNGQMTSEQFLDLAAEESVLDLLPCGRELFVDSAESEQARQFESGTARLVCTVMVRREAGENPRTVCGCDQIALINQAIAVPGCIKMGEHELKITGWRPTVEAGRENVTVIVDVYLPELEVDDEMKIG